MIACPGVTEWIDPDLGCVSKFVCLLCGDNTLHVIRIFFTVFSTWVVSLNGSSLIESDLQ